MCYTACRVDSLHNVKEGNGMFDSIGSKIKAFAKAVCWLGVIASVIYGVRFMANGSPASIVAGLLTIAAGSFLSWLGSCMTYAFGQLVENSDKLVAQMENQNPNEGND